MVKIRLRRVGATKRPMYRIVAADSRSPRNGRFIETLGHYNPLTEPATIVIKEERVQYWIEHGAQPTDVVSRLLSTQAARAAVPEPAPEPAPTTSRGRRTRAASAAVAEAPAAVAEAEAAVAEAEAAVAEPEAEAPPAAEAETETEAQATPQAPEEETSAEEPAR